jgi:uncharacterized DUF497 family protein
MSTEFEWDPIKATIFFDPLSSIVSDLVHSIDEQRFAITGLSLSNVVSSLWFTPIAVIESES